MKRSILTFLFVTLNSFWVFADQGSGVITGTVIDARSQEELIGVNIIIPGTNRGTTTDHNGRFELQNLEPGMYSLEFRYIGYQTRTQPDIIVRGHRPAVLEIALSPTAISGGEVVVSTSYFTRDESAPISRIGFSAEEIRRSPGAGQELSRVIMASPGIATNGDTSQDLLVRGGSPSENGFYIDNIPVPGVNHFERQNGRTNGPIGIVNTDLVEQLDFYAGGFSAAYGNHASSVANIRYREGSRNQFHGGVFLSMAGFGLTVENPVADGKGSVLFSARRSYLDVIAGAINAGGAPRYGDVQFKAVYDINTNNKITVLNIFGDSLFENDLETALEEGFDVYSLAHTYQNTTGINWRRMGSSNFYSNTSLSWSFKQDDTQVYFVDDHSTDIDFDIRRTFITLRNTNYYRLNHRNRFEFGFQLDHHNGDFDYFIGATTNAAGVERPQYQRMMDIDQYLAGIFATWMVQPFDRLSLNIGGRADVNSLNEELTLSPRTGLSYRISEKLTFNASAGVYHQTIPLFFRSQHPDFEALKDFRSTQFIAGFDYQLTPETMLTIEAYEKQYRNLPTLPVNHELGFDIYVLETEMFFDALTDNGESYARGIDVLVQKKLAQNVYGMISGSLFRTEFRDSQGAWQPRRFDVEHIFNIIGGYRPNNRYEFSARWSYIGPRPFTPIDPVASEFQGTTILDYSRYHQERMPAYHSLFVRFDRRWFYNNLSMTTFVEIWNSYNRTNVEAYYWNVSENRIETFNQFSTIPIGGITIDF